MKVIGKSKDGYIFEASNYEIANLIGYYALYDYKNNLGEGLKVGDEIQISKMYRQLQQLAEHQREIESVIETLKETAETLTLVPPVLNHITDEIKEA